VNLKREQDFLNAKCPKRASYTWRSILHGRELLKEGLIWRIGDGQKVRVWSENWIPRESMKRPLGHHPNKEVEMVSELLLENGAGWDEAKLCDTFFEADVEDILKIPVGSAGTVDYLAWNYTKNGVFSVRSAYHLGMQIKRNELGNPGSSMSSDEHKGWLAIWSAAVPNKTKVHCWRLVKNGLAVGGELRRRRIKNGVVCIVCNREETLKHRFWECPHAHHAWELLRQRAKLALVAPPDTIQRYHDLKSWLLSWFGRLGQKELSLAMSLLSQLWFARNEARHSEGIESPDSTVRRAMFLADEWAAINQPRVTTNPTLPGKWSKPAPGWHKANTDGAMLLSGDHGGGGVVLRDHHGGFVAGACHFFPSVCDAENAELLACRRGVLLARELGVAKLELETDSMGAVTKLRSNEVDRSVQGPLVEEIKLLLREFADFSVVHVRRTCNGAAHRLAKEGCDNKCCNVWVEVPPMYLVNLLACDVATS
jgi:ribonuclease HI